MISIWQRSAILCSTQNGSNTPEQNAEYLRPVVGRKPGRFGIATKPPAQLYS